MILGAALAALGSPLLAPLLLGNTSTQAPATFVAAAAALAVVVITACWAPTRRALGAQPASLLRGQ